VKRSGFRRKPGNKYGAIKTVSDGILFDSKLEAFHYEMLKMQLLAGEISDLDLQHDFPLKVNGKLICTYRADYYYYDKAAQKWVISDAKGVKTETFRIKWKLARALFEDCIFELRHKYKIIREK
jgi:hypothetical protein